MRLDFILLFFFADFRESELCAVLCLAFLFGRNCIGSFWPKWSEWNSANKLCVCIVYQLEWNTQTTYFHKLWFRRAWGVWTMIFSNIYRVLSVCVLRYYYYLLFAWNRNLIVSYEYPIVNCSRSSAMARATAIHLYCSDGRRRTIEMNK